MNWIKWLISIFRKQKPEPVKPVDDMTKDEIDVLSVTMHNSGSVKSAKITAKLTKVTTTAGSAALPIEITPHNWQPNDGHTDSLLIAFWKVEDQWYGAYLEHVRIGGSYTIPDALLNMYHNTDHKPYAAYCEPSAFCIMAKNGGERSNIKLASWPISDDHSDSKE